MIKKHIRLSALLVFVVLFSAVDNVSAAGDSFVAGHDSKIALFYCKGFPTVDAPEIPHETLEKALAGYDYKVISSPGDFEIVTPGRIDLLILPYGSAFPLPAWDSIYRFLKKGGSLLVLGGAPFHQPILWDKVAKKWRLGMRQPTYAHELLIGPAEALPISASGGPLFEKSGAKTFHEFAFNEINQKFFMGNFPRSKEGNWDRRTASTFSGAIFQKSPPGFHLKDLKTVYALTVRFATSKDFPGEDGSTGPYLATMRPLVHLVNKDGLPLCAPIVEIDRLRGSEAGARWVFAANDAKLSVELIRACIHRARRGAISLKAYPVHASVKIGETPKIRIRLLHPERKIHDKPPYTALVKVIDSRDNEVFSKKIKLTGKASLWAGAVEISTGTNLKPGLYKTYVLVTAENHLASGDPLFTNTSCKFAKETNFSVNPVCDYISGPLMGCGRRPLFEKSGAKTFPKGAGAPSQRTFTFSSSGQCLDHLAVTGFVVKNNKLLHSGPQLTASRDWLRKNNKVFPVIGTTYMDRDSHRKFLIDPNPALWDEDFRAMSSLGINFVRTGIWTGWQLLVTEKGDVKEEILRALDAFVRTAAKYDIMINFTFFAFLPPAFGGSNPYLDPISLQGQQEFITRIAARYRGVNWIHFDLINEPSYAPPEALWQTRPIGDQYEKKAWKDWLIKKHGPNPDNILNHWQAANIDPFSLPESGDFSYNRLKEKHLPARALDFILFSRDVFNRWTKILSDTVKKAAGKVLVTVGQDEGGTVLRPGQQFFAPYVDYTGMHTWWFNDNLLWDGMVSRVPEKPNLISETGMMRLEDIRGMPWRSPEQAAALLERKFAYAFASGAAGVVQWIWNINPYQPLDNEAVIGSFRVDGSAKPELQVLKKYAEFFKKAAPYLDDFEPAEVFIILPHARLYSGRPMGIEASQKLVRVLADHFNIFPTAISEYALTDERIRGAKLLLLPVPGMVNDKAAAVLVRAAAAGKKIVVTGPLEGNPYGEINDNLKKLGAVYPCPALSFHEAAGLPSASRNLFEKRFRHLQKLLFMYFFSINVPTANESHNHSLTFSKQITQFLRKGAHSSPSFKNNNIWLEPLPLEMADNSYPLIGLLKRVLSEAGISYDFSPTPLPCRLLYAPKAILGICVNETSRKQQKSFEFNNKKITIDIEPGRTSLFLINRSSGELLLYY